MEYYGLKDLTVKFVFFFFYFSQNLPSRSYPRGYSDLPHIFLIRFVFSFKIGLSLYISLLPNLFPACFFFRSGNFFR